MFKLLIILCCFATRTPMNQLILETCLLVVAMTAVAATGVARADEPSRVRFAIVGEDGQPLPCRIHLKDHLQKPCYAEQMPHWADHFVCPGNVELRLRASDYSFQIDAVPSIIGCRAISAWGRAKANGSKSG